MSWSASVWRVIDECVMCDVGRERVIGECVMWGGRE